MLLHGGCIFQSCQKDRGFCFCGVCRRWKTAGDDSSNKTLIWFSSPLTHKEKLEGVKDEWCNHIQSTAIVSSIEADSKCHPSWWLSGWIFPGRQLAESFHFASHKTTLFFHLLLVWCCWLSPALQKLISSMPIYQPLKLLMWKPGRSEQSVRTLGRVCGEKMSVRLC